MSVKIVQDRLDGYRSQTPLEQENAMKEITQEVALSGLARAGFFKVAAFQGGTCLRILYGLNRFSEDLDFALLEPDEAFRWAPYLKSLQVELEAFGYRAEVVDRSAKGNAVKVGFLKDDSIGKLLLLSHRNPGTPRSLKIKLEIDTNPPAGARVEQKYIDFPVTVPVLAYDLPSLFAGKTHALLCRPWAKGRDWYDFLWYVGRKVHPNYELLQSAVDQLGPWKGQSARVDRKWHMEQVRRRITETDWNEQKKDIARFLKSSDLDLLAQWSAAFFLGRLQTLEDSSRVL